MSTLKDQMVKAGLVSSKQARQVAHRERVEHTHAEPAAGERAAAEQAEAVRREREAQKERDLTLNRERLAQQAQREQELQARERHRSQVEAVLRDGRLERWGGPRAYYFQDGALILCLMVSEDAARRLADGTAAIIRTGDLSAPHALLLASAALRLRALEPERVVVLHGAQAP